ncbi:winged helix-turn-helix domain-containing protein [Streptomyces bacillaris]|uniref:winged helix-turn-helix domain-containing protein n=1 Tax=Streptomyces bacillaris TaxID=68179 RepID=UPI0034610044
MSGSGSICGWCPSGGRRSGTEARRGSARSSTGCSSSSYATVAGSSPRQLLTRVWGDESAIGGDRVKFGVLRLRRKLREAAGPDAPDPIEAVRGAGYRFVTAEEIDRKRDEGPAGQGWNTREKRPEAG